MRRLYTDVSIDSAFGIRLDSRPVKTPARNSLILPSPVLAQAIAEEWRAQGDQINPRTMPLTGLANAAIDHVLPDSIRFAKDLSAYGENELLCYRAEDQPELAAKQASVWDPILDGAQARYGLRFIQVCGIMHKPQPPGTLTKLAEIVAGFSPFSLAALSPMVTISGSIIIPLAIIDGVLTPGAGFGAGHLDELWQIAQWGEDDLAAEARNIREADFLAACRFISLTQ